MNDSDLRNDTENKNVYRATTNLNTAIENPQVNINSVTGVNIQEIDNNNYIDLHNNIDVNQGEVQELASNIYDVGNGASNFNYSSNLDNQIDNSNFNDNSNVQPQFIPVNNKADVNYGNSDLSEYNNYINETPELTYRPTLKEKKKPLLSFKITSEFKVILFICFILFISIMVIPYIFDFFWGLY